MKTGFYNLSTLSLEELKSFYKDTIPLSYCIMCESKYTTYKNKWRSVDNKYNINDYIERVNHANHNVCIDRSIQGANLPGTDRGEIGFKLHQTYDRDWHQITFYTTLENFYKLVDKFKLKEL